MQGKTNSADVNETIKQIKTAEDESDKIIHNAKEKAEKILLSGKTKVQEQQSKSSLELSEYKKKKIEEGIKKINLVAEEQINSAKEEAKKIKKAKLDSSQLSELVDEFLSNI